MNNETLIRLYQKIQDLTRKGAIGWQLVEANYFRASFSRASLDLIADYNYDPRLYHLDIRNEDGTIVAYISEQELIEPEYGGDGIIRIEDNVAPLYRTVVDQVYKLEETASSLFDDLENLEKNKNS